MSVENFIDSNVFVYLFDSTDENKQVRAEGLIREAIEHQTGCISFQVVQETINVLTRKLKASAEDARGLLEQVLMPLWLVNPTQALYNRGLEIQARYQFSFYDSLIIAAALDSGCRRLYSEDLQHGQNIQQLVIQNPFQLRPETPS